jgi:ABC-type transport system involved in multi-copper enzyme maturation permease subunit
MALGQPATTWLGRKIGWSNSPQSWAERLGGAVLLAGAAAAVLWGGGLSAVQQVFLWGLLVVAAAVLLRRGWLKLFGPVLFYDMIRSARRGRYVLLRSLYAGLLLFFLFCVWVNAQAGRASRTDRQEAARLAEAFFETFMVVQLVAVTLLTPAYVAGAIADEKDRKTLEFLLATDLRNREIVLSKLVARLANLSLFLLTGLPILSMIQFLGGVDPNLVLAGGAFTALTMAGLGALSILNSTYFKKPRDAIALTYLGVVAYLVVSFLLLWWQAAKPGAMSLPLWFGASAPTVGNLVNAFNAGNLFLVLGKLSEAGGRGSLADQIPRLLWEYACFHGVVLLGLTAWSISRLRVIAIKQAQGLSRSGKGRRRLWRRPGVSSPPMIWKEIFVEGGVRLNWLGRIVVWVLVIATLMPGLLIIGTHFDALLSYWTVAPRYDPRALDIGALEMNIYVRTMGTLVACMTLLGVAVRASTSISGERDRQTLDALLTSPLDSSEILYAKWLGAMVSMRWSWLWLGLIWGLGLITGGLSFFALPFLTAVWVVYAAFGATLGLWWSLVARTTTRATVLTLLTAVFIAVGHWLPWMCCVSAVPMFGRELEAIIKVQVGFTPAAVLSLLAFRLDELQHGTTEFSFGIIIGVFLWIIMTVTLYAVLNNRFRLMSGRNRYRSPEFNTRLSRVRPLPVRPIDDEPP